MNRESGEHWVLYEGGAELSTTPRGSIWSPNGRWIAFTLESHPLPFAYTKPCEKCGLVNPALSKRNADKKTEDDCDGDGEQTKKGPVSSGKKAEKRG